MKLSELNIGQVNFSWGLKLSDIISQIDNIEKFENENKYSKSQSLRIKIKSFLGHEINSVEFRSSFKDRIINSISINLPLSTNSTKNIVESLNTEFGNFTTSGKSENYGTGSVPEFYRWKLDNCDIGLSIYGGVRNDYNEQNKAGIWLILRDIELLYELYSKDVIIRTSHIDKDIQIQSKIRTGKYQKQSNFLEKENYPNHNQDYISIALNGYMKRNLMLTPNNLRIKMENAEVGILKSESTNRQYVANKFECIELKDIHKFKWVKMHPAKGPGNNWLQINDFTVRDIYDSNAIENLCEKIKPIIDCKLEYIEDHDC